MSFCMLYWAASLQVPWKETNPMKMTSSPGALGRSMIAAAIAFCVCSTCNRAGCDRADDAANWIVQPHHRRTAGAAARDDTVRRAAVSEPRPSPTSPRRSSATRHRRRCPGPWAKVVFTADFTVTAGRQFDRTAAFYLGHASIFYGTTAEPRSFAESVVARGARCDRSDCAV